MARNRLCHSSSRLDRYLHSQGEQELGCFCAGLVLHWVERASNYSRRYCHAIRLDRIFNRRLRIPYTIQRLASCFTILAIAVHLSDIIGFCRVRLQT